MDLTSIRIVLVATTHPGNIGSTARAMKTMGLRELYLVTPKIFPDLKAYELAAGADDILEDAHVVESLNDAIADCHLVFATSARPRGINLPEINPRDCAQKVSALGNNTKVAILFGREHAGLTNEELLRSHYHVNIPSNPSYSSLNLAQAVQILAYELRMALSNVKTKALKQDEIATHEEVERFYQHLEDVMITTEFLNPAQPKRLQQRLRRLFNRVNLEKMEVNILRGILKNIQVALKINKGD